MGAASVAPTGEGGSPEAAEAAAANQPPPWAVALALGAAAIVVRTTIWHRTVAMMNDGPVFIGLAERFAAGEWRAAISHAYHPLYPMLVAAAKPLFDRWDSAGAAVSIVAGGFAVVFLYDFLRRALDPSVAALGALLLAVHPYAAPYSSDVQSEGVYFALFLGAVAMAWRALEAPRFGLALGAGLLSGFAYLTRPEGVGVALAASLVMAGLWLRGLRSARGAAIFGVGVALGVAVVAAPYTAAVRQETGELQLTRKKSVSAIATLEGGRRAAPSSAAAKATKPDAPGPAARVRAAVGELMVVSKRSFRLDHLIIGGLGLIAIGGPAGLRAAYLAALVGLYAFVLIGLHLNASYVSMRHALPPLLPLLGYVALGVPTLGRAALFLPRVLARRAPPSPRLALLAGCVILVGASTTMALRPQRVERAGARAVAEWLAERGGVERVAAAKEREAYYAGAAYVRLPRPKGTRHGDWIDTLRVQGVRYAIIDERAAKRYPGLEPEGADDRIRVLHRAGGAGRSAAAIEILGAQAPKAGGAE